MSPEPDSSSIIDALGGTCVVATLCDVSPQAVSQWRTDGIPRARAKFLRLARPEVFDVLERAGGPAVGGSRATNGASQSDTCTEKVA